MLKYLPKLSTACCYYLYKFIKSFREVIVKKYLTYKKYNYVCKVYICSRKCSKYLC
jgi:hypothetical protein